MEDPRKVMAQENREYRITRKHKLSLVLLDDKQNKKSFASILKKRENPHMKKKPSILKQYLKPPKIDHNFLTEQIKCFMTCKQKHTSHIIDVRVSNRAIKKISESNRLCKSYNIDFTQIEKLALFIHQKNGNSDVLLSSYEDIWKNYGDQYPPTVKMMLNYFGAYLYSVFGHYEESQAQTQKIFNTIVKYKVQEFFIIYLLLKIKLKSNLSEWSQSIKCLTKLLYFAWMYSMTNLQIWCYFEFSRAYFFLNQENQANIFRLKSENNSIQSKKSIYREVCVAELVDQISNIWEGKLDFTFNKSVQSTRLQIPQFQKYKVDQYIKDQRLLKSSIKTIAQQCKIRHVGNLLTRVSQIGYYQLSKADNLKIPQNKGGNNFLLTHQSFNKNMNMFFRKKLSKGCQSKPVFYTIQNSNKNWTGLKDMLRYIIIQMNQYSPFSSWQYQQRNILRCSNI